MAEDNDKRRRSPYWKHFQRLDGDKNMAICNHCRQILSGHFTGNLSRHIRFKHPDVMNAIEEAQMKLVRAANRNVPSNVDDETHSSTDTGVFLLSVGTEDENNLITQEYNAIDQGKKINILEDNIIVSGNEIIQIDAEENIDQEEYEEYEEEVEIFEKPTRKKRVNFSENYPKTRAKMIKNTRNQEADEEEEEDENVADRFDIFGTLVAVKMRGLNHDQMIIAEKLINDTLHQAEMNNLNCYTKLNMVQVDMIDENTTRNRR